MMRHWHGDRSAATCSDPQSMTSSLGEAVVSALEPLLPMFGALIGLVLLAAVVLGGWNFSPAGDGARISRA